jgi:hypothetical protein
MSLTLAIVLNVVADLALLGLLAFVMTRAGRLTPHAADDRSAERVTRSAHAARPARSAGRYGKALPARS